MQEKGLLYWTAEAHRPHGVLDVRGVHSLQFGVEAQMLRNAQLGPQNVMLDPWPCLQSALRVTPPPGQPRGIPHGHPGRSRTFFNEKK